MVFIFDIDGTIADISHRLHFIQRKPADWDAFFDACVDDLPIPEVIEIAWCLHKNNHKIILVSGRSDAVRDKTMDWLRDFNVPFDDLFMRKAGDHRQDDVVKQELLNQVRKVHNLSDIRGVFEDRKQVVTMYRNFGLRVFQVAEGDF